MKKNRFTIALLVISSVTTQMKAQHDEENHTELHVDPRWEQCSIQFDSSLTQQAFGQFTKEVALLAYFRPLTHAKPMGVGGFELSLLQWQTGINEDSDAWNDTFVHPDSTHWLVGGPRLPFPGLTLRAGITKTMDAGVYYTTNPNANYSVIGGQLQYNLCYNEEKGRAAAIRLSYMKLFGPEDLKFNSLGLDLVASKKFALYKNWLSLSPYAGVSTYFATARETSKAVDLKKENKTGLQGWAGAELQASVFRIGAEYNFAQVNSLSFKFGIAYNFSSAKSSK